MKKPSTTRQSSGSRGDIARLEDIPNEKLTKLWELRGSFPSTVKDAHSVVGNGGNGQGENAVAVEVPGPRGAAG
jgi:hypothetical protein